LKSRLRLFLLLVAAWAGVVAWRLYDLQVARHAEFRQRAERQQQRVVQLDPPRGAIYDARGRELAVSVEVESAFAVPRQVTDAPATARALARVLGLDAGRLERALGQDGEFVWVARKLDPPQAKAVAALELEGVYFLRESKRYYPLRELAGAVLGYVGTDNQGLSGLEAAFDAQVAGTPGRRTVLRDARRGTLLDPDLSFADAQPGSDLHLTLDAAIQYVVERELRAAVARHRAAAASAVVMDPATGAVLAMASIPGFDPNRFAEYSAGAWRNRAVMDAFEPGSTFKMVTAAAALEANVLDPADTIDCGLGGITLAGVRINDHQPFGVLTFREVIARSSNVGAIKAGLRVGAQRLHAAVRAFGFGEPTGIDLPGESPGIVRPLERWSPLTKAYVAFGQGLSVTPLQLTAAFAAVANGGALPRPYVVAQIGRAGETPARRPPPPARRQVASAATLRALERLLEAVVEDGTGKTAAVEGYSVAGKTGTAQKAVAGGYSPDRFVASFVGFAPARRPALVAAVVVDEPRGALYHGGDVAAPVFGAIAREALLYLGVAAEREPLERWPGEPDLAAPAAGPALLAAGAGKPIRDAAPGREGFVAASLEPMAAASGVVPDFAGLTARQAVTRSSRLGLRPVLRGRGVVDRQLPEAGAPLPRRGERIELWLGTGSR
jgi:cell division protein FtsI (penicillin-binding protein 3)